jgi:CubicO group peptidase (beta-lactamase class C family)
MRHALLLLTPLTLAAPLAPLGAQALTAAERTAIDSTARAVLTHTGAPSASIAVVRGARIVYEQAYGTARRAPDVPATSAMRYAIGSVSKQMTATAVLMLADEGKLSLDDPVAKWYPALTRAKDITLRHLLSMTSGYQDYWPQDYVLPDMQRPVTMDSVIRRWAAKPLDFAPGAQWQYSNTNYMLAGLIVERVSGQPFAEFLRQRIFTKLGMTSVVDIDAAPLGTADAQRLLRHAVGPLHEAPKEATGWLFGAGQWAMTAHDLALWDIGMIRQQLVSPAAYRAQQSDTRLTSGLATGYGLGIFVGRQYGHRRLEHGGAVSGYTTSNNVYPDDSIAVVVYTNIYPGGADAPAEIARGIAAVLFSGTSAAATAALADAKRVYEGLRMGTIDRARLTPAANAFFTDDVLRDYKASLGALGAPTSFTRAGETLRGGLVIRNYAIRAGGLTLDLSIMATADGTFDQVIVSRVN